MPENEQGGYDMISICCRKNEIPNDIKEVGDWHDWEYVIIPDSYKEIKEAENIALSVCYYDYKKFRTKNGRVFFITYYI